MKRKRFTEEQIIGVLRDVTRDLSAAKIVAYDGPFLKVRRDAVRLPDGKPSWREYVEHPGAVMVLAFLDDDTLVLMSTTRYNGGGHDVRMEVMGEKGTISAGLDHSLAMRSAEQDATHEEWL